MAKVNVFIEDWVDIDLNEIDTDDLMEELKSRDDVEEIELIPKFKEPQGQLAFIKETLGLKNWHDKERVLQEIELLYKF